MRAHLLLTLGLILTLTLAGCTQPEEAVIVNDGGTKDCTGDWQRLVDLDVGHDMIDIEYLTGSDASVTVRILDPAGETVHEKEDTQASDKATRRRFQEPAEGLWLVEARCVGATTDAAFAWTVVATGTK